MKSTKYKYKLNELISGLPRSINIGTLTSILQKEHKITTSVFYRDRSIQANDEASISADRLEIYAGLFGVPVSSLKNYESKPIKPLSERKSLNSMAGSIVNKTKLKK